MLKRVSTVRPGVRIVRKSDGAIIAGISFNTPDGSTASDVYKVATDYIAKQIKDALENSFILFPTSEQFTVEHDGGSIVKISSNIAEDFSIITSDGFGDQTMYAIKDNVTLFSDLPRHAPDGFTVKVSGNAEALAAQGYYVKATKSTPTSTGTGFPLVTWVECPAQGISKGIDNTTMPISIKRNQDGSFTIDSITYGERVVGDLETAPSPKFVGNKINGVFFYSNRLGFFSNDSISLSGSGDLFSFFPTSVATILATDNIEISINSPRVSLIRHIIPWNEACIIFSDTHQYVMKSNGALSVETLSIQPATDFHVNTRATPRASGTNIYFANEHGKYTEVREYYVNNLTASKEASNITAHVPTYIPSGVTWIACSGNSNNMVMFSENDNRNLYIYQTQWSGDEKVQSAWHKFNFGKYEIVCGFFKGEDLYMIVRKYGDTSTQLVSLNFSNDYVEGVAPFIIYLDNRVTSSQVNITYNEESNQTTITLPFDVDELTRVVDARETERYYGNLIEHTEGLLSTQMVLKGDYRNIPLYFGNIYEMKYNLGHVYIRDNNNQGSTVRTTGVTTILKLLVTYGDSCEFKVLVDTEGREKKYSEFHGRVKGDFDNTFGKINPETGVFKVGVGAKNDKTDIVFINDSHLPCSIQFLDFVLRYWNSNGSRVG